MKKVEIRNHYISSEEHIGKYRYYLSLPKNEVMYPILFINDDPFSPWGNDYAIDYYRDRLFIGTLEDLERHNIRYIADELEEMGYIKPVGDGEYVRGPKY